ncbi:MAG: DsbA family protein [Rubritepida sp.]|jgi:protein-disulfide isomerase|nr:DsbA family protein [Rubritepida sp.]
MDISRRTLGLGAALLATAAPWAAARPAAAQGAGAATTDPRLAPRGIGSADARVVVTEFFSLTCGHCATFHNNVWPQVKRELVDTGRVRMVWRDFPLDGVALLAAAVARSLPADRYDAFLTTLFQTQDRWAFAQGRQAEELARLASLAGMDRERFNAIANDQDFLRGILAQRLEAEQRYQIRATPSFLFNARLHTGGLSFAEFERQVRDAPRT